MPWEPSDAHGHTHKANTPEKKRQWRDVANSALSRGQSEGSAVRQANAVVGGSHAAKPSDERSKMIRTPKKKEK